MLNGKKIVLLTTAALCLGLIPGALGFTGESAGVSELLDFLTNKDLKRVGDGLVNEMMGLCRDNFEKVLLANPNMTNPRFITVTDYLIALLGPVFLFAILFSGIYLIYFSGSPTVRATIKSMLPSILAAIVLVILSTHIINLVLYLSENLCQGVIDQSIPNSIAILIPEEKDMVNPVTYLMERFERMSWYSAEASFPFLLFSMAILAGLLLVVVARYLIVSLFVMVFPVTVFLYLFLPTRRVGRRVMEQTILWIFLQTIEAIALLCVTTIIAVLGTFMIEEIMVVLKLSGMIALIALPVATIVYIKDFLPG